MQDFFHQQYLSVFLLVVSFVNVQVFFSVMVVLSLCDLLVSLMSKFYVLVKEEMEWTVIPFLRVFFFLSSLFKKAFIQLAENWLILSNPNVHRCFELILQKRQQTPGVFCIASPDEFHEAQSLHP